jgi:hypothetical protein
MVSLIQNPKSKVQNWTSPKSSKGQKAMAEFINEVQAEAQRGLILRILVAWRMEWIPFYDMRIQVLRRLGYVVPDQDIQFHLKYLEQNGYAESKRLRAGRVDYELQAVRATSKAVDLIEGRIPADEGVAL